MHGIKIIFLWTKDFWFENLFYWNYKCQLLSALFDYLLAWIYYRFRTPDNIYTVESVLQTNHGLEVKVASKTITKIMDCL